MDKVEEEEKEDMIPVFIVRSNLGSRILSDLVASYGNAAWNSSVYDVFRFLYIYI